jgi:hypothetical protein
MNIYTQLIKKVHFDLQLFLINDVNCRTMSSGDEI